MTTIKFKKNLDNSLKQNTTAQMFLLTVATLTENVLIMHR